MNKASSGLGTTRKVNTIVWITIRPSPHYHLSSVESPRAAFSAQYSSWTWYMISLLLWGSTHSLVSWVAPSAMWMKLWCRSLAQQWWSKSKVDCQLHGCQLHCPQPCENPIQSTWVFSTLRKPKCSGLAPGLLHPTSWSLTPSCLQLRQLRSMAWSSDPHIRALIWL